MTVKDTHPARWNAVRDALRGKDATEVRVLCPRGHFIVNVQVLVPQLDILGGNDPAILIAPRADNGHSLGDGQTLGDVFDSERPQFRMYQAKGYRVAMHCKRSKCGYAGTFDYDGLAFDLARATSDGHAEHRMTS